jgi:UDP-glucose 4-epimerase
LKNNTLVIGANGFLGSNLSKRLLTDGHNVYAVYNLQKNNIPEGCILLTKDELFEIKNDIDYIFYCPGSYKNNHLQNIEINCILLSKIITKYKYAKIIYTSSTSVYGLANNIINENSCFNNPSLYGQSKICGEFITKGSERHAIIRFTYLYGPFLNNNSFLPNIISQAKSENRIILYGNGDRKQDYLHITDAINLCIKAMYYENNDIFLGATGVTYSNLEVANLVQSFCENTIIEFSGEETGTSIIFNSDSTKFKLNWKPCILINDGIKNMFN